MVQLMPVGLEMTLPLPVPRPVMVSLLELASDSDGRVISVASWQPKITPTRNTRLIAATFFIRKRTFTVSRAHGPKEASRLPFHDNQPAQQAKKSQLPPCLRSPEAEYNLPGPGQAPNKRIATPALTQGFPSLREPTGGTAPR